MIFIPYYPTREEVLKKLYRIIIPKNNAKIMDLGSGDGRIIELFAKNYDDVLLYGVEKNPVLAGISKKRLRKFGDKVSIIENDFFQHDLNKYDIIYSYLTRKAYSKLQYKISDFIDSGGVLITYDIPITKLRPTLRIPMETVGNKHSLYVYYSNKIKSIDKKLILNI